MIAEKVIAVIFTLLVPVVCSAVSAYLFYSRMRYGDEWRERRRVALSLHKSVLYWLIMLAGMLVIVPVVFAFDYDDQWAGYIAMMCFGFLSLVPWGYLKASAYVPVQCRSYVLLLASSVFAGATSQVLAGTCWIMEMPRIVWLEWTFNTLSFGFLICLEGTLLWRNHWRLLPQKLE